MQTYFTPRDHFLARAVVAANQGFSKAVAELKERKRPDDSVDVEDIDPPRITEFYMVTTAAKQAAAEDGDGSGAVLMNEFSKNNTRQRQPSYIAKYGRGRDHSAVEIAGRRWLRSDTAGNVPLRHLATQTHGPPCPAPCERGGQELQIRQVAVSNPLQRELADTEISLLKSLNHPNIMKMHEVYFENGGGGRSVTNGNIYLVTELCEGGDLFSRILHHYGRLKQPMTESHVAFMMTQILSATKYCHEKGIVHRDIKPENILFVDRSSSSPVKIIDFGLANFTAKIREQAKEVDLPRSGRLGQLARLLPAVNGKHVIPLQERKTVMQKAGTPHYMAPEMIEGEYDHLADMFSIGIILCQLFTGWHPFYQPGDDEVSVRVKISDPEPVRFPADIWEFVSQQAQDLCRKLLDKNPRTRLSAAQALRHSWFEDGKPSAFGNKEVLSVSIFDGLMKYQAYNKLKRAVLQLLTRELSEFQIQELRNKFMGLDTQGDGLLSPEVAAFVESASARYRKSYTWLSD
ncbi:unnamed protein product [Prorocentrum cordatum]|uniref:Protein kinase domain-containing protein n=1 Tax=Prorocentrum cordatum TaxID=2364126 RepID=A0ABN9U8N8_9DINO|nr:unnamed protein product [Polarella glacialis]